MHCVATTITPDEAVWNKLRYLMHDIPDSKDTFENFVKLMNDKLKWKKITPVKHTKIYSKMMWKGRCHDNHWVP